DERHAAFGFFRAGRAMRRPDFYLAVLALEFGAAVADQRVQRIRRRGDAERLHLVARRPRQGGGVFLFRGEAELLCQFGIERRNRRGSAVIRRREFALRGFGEAPTPASRASFARLGPRKREMGRRWRLRGIGFSAGRWCWPRAALSRLRGRVGWGRLSPPRRLRILSQRSRIGIGRTLRKFLRRRFPRAMRGGFAAGAAVPGIIRRRLQAGARAHAALAAIDRGIEQFRQRRPDRLHFGTVGFGFRGFGLCGSVGIVRQGPEYGASQSDIKGFFSLSPFFTGPRRAKLAL